MNDVVHSSHAGLEPGPLCSSSCCELDVSGVPSWHAREAMSQTLSHARTRHRQRSDTQQRQHHILVLSGKADGHTVIDDGQMAVWESDSDAVVE